MQHRDQRKLRKPENLISPVALLSGTLRGLEEEVAQSNPGSEVSQLSSPGIRSRRLEAKRTASKRVRWRSMVDALCSSLGDGLMCIDINCNYRVQEYHTAIQLLKKTEVQILCKCATCKGNIRDTSLLNVLIYVHQSCQSRKVNFGYGRTAFQPGTITLHQFNSTLTGSSDYTYKYPRN